MSRNVFTMRQSLGPYVLICNTNLSYDKAVCVGHNVLKGGDTDLNGVLRMVPRTLSQFDQDFIGRTRLAREDAKFTQIQIARLLDIPQDRYKHYETRTPLPHEFVEKFCIATRVTIEWLYTGDEKKAA